MSLFKNHNQTVCLKAFSFSYIVISGSNIYNAGLTSVVIRDYLQEITRWQNVISNQTEENIAFIMKDKYIFDLINDWTDWIMLFTWPALCWMVMSSEKGLFTKVVRIIIIIILIIRCIKILWIFEIQTDRQNPSQKTKPGVHWKKITYHQIDFAVLAKILKLNFKTVLFQTILFRISTQFKYQNSSISSNSV